jgi:hypothetical protein
LLIQIFEAVDDDRMATFVPFLLQKSIEYLNQSPQNNQILRFIQILYKNLEWALDVDPEIIQANCAKNEGGILFQLLTENFLKLPPVKSSIFERFGFEFIEHRRLTSKILTILLRGFLKIKQNDCEDFFRICIQNLVQFNSVF